MARKNPTSPLRKGFDFQDLWVIKLSIDWIREPSKYKWIKFETKPEGVKEYFAFDDIILCDKNDNYYLYQLKHKQNSNIDFWTWDDFLKQETGKKSLKDSLFQKWFKSYSGNSEKIAFIAFITNGFPGDDLKEYISENKIDIAKVKSFLPHIYETIISQLSDEDLVYNFFSNLTFLFGQKDLEELEMEIKEFFFSELRATDSGVNNLLINLHNECRKQYSTSLDIERILSWCEFDVPEALEQNFDIPDDFEFFNADIQDKVLADLANPEGGIKVFCGKPGSGKSTYLSKLNQVLMEKDVIVFRHHYYLSSKDPSQSERLVSQRVIEGIKAQFKEYPEELEGLANKNSANISLREYISQLAHYFYEKNQSFVIIIDGLDHVLRYSDFSELTSFLKEICFPQPGLWLIFGTQEISKSYLPQTVFDKYPENQWIEIKGLSEYSVKKLILKNTIELKLPVNEFQIEELSEKIYKLTEGNPLHLRYTLHQLKTNCKSGFITVYDCENIIPYEEDIEKYYTTLWKQLPEEGKTIALVISSVSFSFHKSELLELLSSIVSSPWEVSRSYSSISHLLTETKGLLSIYHSSFELFMLSRQEFEQQKLSLMTGIKNWLEKSKYEDLKWAELKKLNYELGDPKEILEINKEWLIEAICYPRCCEGIISQLSLAVKAAFENKLFDRAFELETLMKYYVNSFQFLEIPNSKIWQEAFKRRRPDVSRINMQRLSWEGVFKSQNKSINADLISLPSRHIQLIAEISEKQGNFKLISEAIDRLSELHSHLNVKYKGEIGAEIPQLAVSLIKTVSLDRRHDVKKIYSYIKQFSESGWSTELFGIYTNSLLKTHQISKVYELLALEIEYKDRIEILDKCIENDLELNKQRFLEIVYNSDHGALDNLCLLYLLLNGKDINYIPSLPPYGEFPLNVPLFETEKRLERSKIFSENFILGLIYGILNEDLDISCWIEGAPIRWPLRIMSQVFASSLEISKFIVEKKPPYFSCLFKNISKVSPLTSYDREIYELQNCFKVALSSVLKILYLIGCKFEIPSLFNSIELTDIFLEKKYYDENDFLLFLVSFDIPLLSNGTYAKFISHENNRWSKLILDFYKRSEHYSDLAKLAAIHKDNENQDYFLKAATANLLGYGYHKDMYLDNVLDSITICEQTGSLSIENWIQRLANAIEHINEYTDADETRYFPIYYAEILGKHNPKLLYKYYYFVASGENWFLASRIFKYVLRSLNFHQDDDVALALTALDECSLDELRSIAKENTNAEKVLEIIHSSIGDVDYFKKEHSSNNYLESQVHDYSLVEPNTVFECLESFDSYWEKSSFLLGCVNFWLNEQQYDKNKIYQILIHYVNEHGLRNVSYSLLDVLFPLAYEFDSDKAFEYICLAQAKSFGWSTYTTEKEIFIDRCRFIKEHYPERYMEFYIESIRKYSKALSSRGEFSVPIPRSIEFFSIFEEFETMEKITDASVKCIDFLMANLEFSPFNWTDIEDIDKIDLLLQRLEYPNDYVIKGARLGLNKLKENPLKKEIILQRIELNNK